MPDFKLTDQDMVDILEEIAQGDSATARIQAIKLLREIRAGAKSVPGGFAELDGDDELARRRGGRAGVA